MAHEEMAEQAEAKGDWLTAAVYWDLASCAKGLTDEEREALQTKREFAAMQGCA